VITTQTRTREIVRIAPAPRLRDEEGVRYGVAHIWLVASALLAGTTGLPRPASYALVALTALLGGGGLSVRWRLGLALAGWAIWTGFLDNTLGLLSFSVADLLRLAPLCGLAAVGAPLLCLLRPRGNWDTLGP
jgi:hypothetical protein